MSPRRTFYAFIAALAATVASGLFYFVARTRYLALRDAGEGTADEIRSTVRALDISFLTLIVASILAVILFSCFVTLKRRDGGGV
jgi:hypothetical protein